MAPVTLAACVGAKVGDAKEVVAASHDPLKQWSQQMEDAGSSEFASQFLKMLAIQIALALMIVNCNTMFTFNEIKMLIKLLYMIEICAILLALGRQVSGECTIFRWQMSGAGSNMLGTILSCLDKLCYQELRCQDLEGKSRDAKRHLDQTAEEAMEAGSSWPDLKKALLSQMVSYCEVHGWSEAHRQMFVGFFNYIRSWISSDALPAWKVQIASGVTADADRQTALLENARTFLQGLDDLVVQMEFCDVSEIQNL